MDKVRCDSICRNHSARSDRDQYRICPTKLSKPELENLYFALLENNLELKKTINGQQDRIKMLSTKIQRMNASQRGLQAVEKKDCCVATKAAVNQQKELIMDLKRTNERMADRIRKLNMRLCSAKQFCKSATPRCLRCSTATSPYLIKHSPCSFKQQSQSTLKLAVSCHNLSRDALISKYVQTESYELMKYNEDKKCEDNRCRTFKDELKQSIVNLQEELSECSTQWSERVRIVEGNLSSVRSDLVRARSERAAVEYELQQKEDKLTRLVTNLRTAEGLSSELKTQLSIEKRKVVELETRLKAATMSNRVTQTIEDTLTSIQESNRTTSVDVTLTCPCSPSYHNTEHNAQHTCLESSPKDKYCDESKLSKSITDDSGYAEANRSHDLLDDKSLNKIIDELSKRIVVLQTQVDALTISPPVANSIETKTDDHSTATENQSSTTEMESFLTVSKTNERTPPKVSIQQVKDISSPECEELTQKNDSKINSNGMKPVSPKHNSNNSLQVPVPVPRTKQSSHCKTNIAKATLFKAKDSDTVENDSKFTERVEVKRDDGETNIDGAKKREGGVKITDNVEESKVDFKKAEGSKVKDKTEEIKETSKSSEEKTYNIKDKDQNIFINNNHSNVQDKSNINREENITKEEQLIWKDKKSKSQENVSRHRGSPRRSLTEIKDVKEKLKYNRVKMTKAYKNTEQKVPVPKQETLARAESSDGSSCEEHTYTVDCSKSTRSSSPDNTDYEISSMTDLTDEKESKSPMKDCLSPGEQKYTTTHTDSFTTPTTNYSLSEGEIPVSTVKRKPNEDKPRAENRPKETKPQMEETLQAITDELARCKRLLFSQRSHENTSSAVM